MLAKQPMDFFTTEQVRRYINGQMHEDHDVSRRARRKDTLTAEDLGVLLQWHYKYGTSTFANGRRRVQVSLLILFSAFTCSRPATLLAENDFTTNDACESSTGDSSGRTSADDCHKDTLVSDDIEPRVPSSRPRTICYGDIDLFLLRNPDNPDRDILMAEVDFRNLKG